MQMSPPKSYMNSTKTSFAFDDCFTEQHVKKVINFQGKSFHVVSKVVSDIVESSLRYKEEEFIKKEGVPHAVR